MTEIISLPSIRKLIRPDPGYVLIDGDLKGADAQIVAWEAGAERLKAIFRSGSDIHIANAQSIWGQSASAPERQLAKVGVHLTNYGGKARTLASSLGISIRDAEDFQRKWFEIHPEIRRWHQHIEHQVRLTRQIKNVYGFRRFYFDRLDNILPQALAWLGQSPVAITINKAMLHIHRNFREAQLLLQVHDSLLMQIPESMFNKFTLNCIIEEMSITIPFSDPLIIPIEIKYSRDNWGDMVKWKPGEELRDAA